MLWIAPVDAGRSSVVLRGDDAIVGVEAESADATDLRWYGSDGTSGTLFEGASNQYAFSLAIDAGVATADIVTVSAGNGRVWLDRYGDDLTPLLQTHWDSGSDSYVDVGVATNGPRITVLSGVDANYGYKVRAYDGTNLGWTLDQLAFETVAGVIGTEPRDIVSAGDSNVLIGGTFHGPGGNMAWVAVSGPPAP